jgi:hypothetical protein
VWRYRGVRFPSCLELVHARWHVSSVDSSYYVW